MSELHIQARYARLGVDDGVELAERNYQYADLDWRFPLTQAALVCLDVWTDHYSRDCHERVDSISRNPIASAVAACRAHGLQVIHAPAPTIAHRSPKWLNLVDNDEQQPQWPNSPEWPPQAFKERTGEYAQFKKPVESHEAQNMRRHLNDRDYHPSVRPDGDDVVIATGEELHRHCAQRGIFHLFYVGFNTNACMIWRDYGMMQMMARGYTCILLRDCTTGMEIAETLDDMICTRGIIATLEQFGAYTVTSTQLIEALTACEHSS